MYNQTSIYIDIVLTPLHPLKIKEKKDEKSPKYYI